MRTIKGRVLYESEIPHIELACVDSYNAAQDYVDRDFVPRHCFFGIEELVDYNTVVGEIPNKSITRFNGMPLDELLESITGTQRTFTHFVLSEAISARHAFAICTLSGIFQRYYHVDQIRERLFRIAQFLEIKRMNMPYDHFAWQSEQKAVRALEGYLSREKDSHPHLQKWSPKIPWQWSTIANILLFRSGEEYYLQYLRRNDSHSRENFFLPTDCVPKPSANTELHAVSSGAELFIHLKLYTEFAGWPAQLYESRAEEIADLHSKEAKVEIIVVHQKTSNRLLIGLANKEQAKLLPGGWQKRLCRELNDRYNSYRFYSSRFVEHTTRDGFGSPNLPHLILGRKNCRYRHDDAVLIFNTIDHFLRSELTVLNLVHA